MMRAIMVLFLSLGLVDADFSILPIALRDGEIELTQFGRKETSARSGSRGHVCDSLVAPALGLNHIKKTLAAGNVETLARGVVEQVIGVAGNGKVGYGLSSSGVKDHEWSRLAAADEELVICFVESHREVGFEFHHRPGRHNVLRLPIHD